MATVKELITRFGFEIDDKGLHQLEEGLHAAKDGLLGIGIVGAGAAATLFGLVKHAADAKEQLYFLSQRLGIGVEDLRKLGFQGKLAGLSLDDMTQTLTFLNKNIENAKHGSPELRKAFRQVGISGDQLRSGAINAGNALQMLSTRFATMQNGPKKVQIAMELFGRGGGRMIQLLNNMSHGFTPLQQAVFDMGHATEESAKQGHEFNDAFELMELAISSVGKKIGTALIPVATDILNQITTWIVLNKDLIKTNVTGFANALTASLKATVRIVDILIKSLSGLAQGFGGVEFATKSLLITMSVLSGASLLIGIGKLIQGVTALGNSFAIASLKAAAIPLLIGAAFIALLLIMEDIYSFFSGKDSFLGDILKKVPQLGKSFAAIFEPIFEPLVAFITKLTDGFSSWKDIFTELGILIINVLLTPFRLLFTTIGNIIAALGALSGSKGLKDAASFITDTAGKITAQGIGESVTGVTPGLAFAGASGSKNQTITLGGVKQEFNFPPGTDPAVVGDKISNSVSDGLDDVLRKTSQSTSNGGAY